jgi:hypothetical protein
MEPAPAISLATPADYVEFDAYTAAVVAEIKAQGFAALTAKENLGDKVTASGYDTSPGIAFNPYAWSVNIPTLNVGVQLYVDTYKDFAAGDPIREAQRRIELAGGVLKPVVAPPTPPAASDAWRNLPIGTAVTIDGVNYVIEDIGGCGPTPCRRKSAPVADPSPDTPTVAGERAASVKYATGVLFMDANEDVQASWKAYLAWLSKRP